MKPVITQHTNAAGFSCIATTIGQWRSFTGGQPRPRQGFQNTQAHLLPEARLVEPKRHLAAGNQHHPHHQQQQYMLVTMSGAMPPATLHLWVCGTVRHDAARRCVL